MIRNLTWQSLKLSRNILIVSSAGNIVSGRLACRRGVSKVEVAAERAPDHDAGHGRCYLKAGRDRTGMERLRQGSINVMICAPSGAFFMLNVLTAGKAVRVSKSLKPV